MDGNSKQLIAGRIKDATNILITVNRNPSVDQLAAAIGLSVMLNKLDKHATAIFSGQVPHAIDFLEPGKTFESNVSSLRDFIIALDKEKADRLRYKVEDGVVRIFITPYRTTITQNDLQFSEGDFNVELVIGLGVDNNEDLDEAIRSHGRILHDAAVVTINTAASKHSLGEINWTDDAASSLSEMLMSLSESLKSGILDEQIANALLTGIVAATNRFSNEHTTPRVMTMAAQLMAAGANQQLITAQLQTSGDVSEVESAQKSKDSSQPLRDGQSAKLTDEKPAQPAADGEIHVTHEKPDAVAVAEELAHERPSAAASSVETVEHDLPLPKLPSTPSVSDLQRDIAEANQSLDQEAARLTPPSTPAAPPAPEAARPTVNASVAAPVESSPIDWRDKIAAPPSMGGTLNATTSEAEAAREAEASSSTNHTILQHGSPSPAATDPFGMNYEETPAVGYISSSKQKTLTPLSVPPQTSDFSGLTLSQIDEQTRQKPTPAPAVAAEPVVSSPTASVDDARAAVDAALGVSALPPASQPLQPSGDDQFQPVSTPLPPLPDFSTLPPLPQDNQPPIAAPEFSQPQPQAVSPAPADPGQFQIPGQQS